jgi:predicted outer membrane repeat protein
MSPRLLLLPAFLLIVHPPIASALKAPAIFSDYIALNFSQGNYSANHTASGADPDGDGLSNHMEFVFGTNPVLSDGEDSKMQISLSGGNVTLSGYGRLGRKYTMQSSTNLAAGFTADSSFNGSDTMETQIESQGNATRKFFRTSVEVIPPLYVDKDSTASNKDGRSWATAFSELQDAINAAELGQEIWVAEGIYHPTEIDPYYAELEITENKYKTFSLKEGISIIGGFAGSENAVSERSGNLTTTLSGDFLNNDGWTENGTLSDEAKPTLSENAYHVLMTVDLRIPVSIANLEITGGVAIKSDSESGWPIEYPTPENSGGGILVVGSNLEILGCRFFRNIAAEHGGAIAVTGDQLSIGDQTIGGAVSKISILPGFGNTEFSQNHVALYADTGKEFGAGGAIQMSVQSVGIFRDTIFHKNTAPNGGAVGLYQATATFIDTSFIENSAFAGPLSSDPTFLSPLNGIGGAISSELSDLKAVSCYFGFNLASTNGYEGQNGQISGFGGALFYIDNGSTKISLSIFDQNYADGGGGGVCVFPSGVGNPNSLSLDFTSFYKNTSDWGPAIANWEANVVGNGNIFFSNTYNDGTYIDLEYYEENQGPSNPFNLSYSLFSGNNTAVVNSGTNNQSIDPGSTLFNNPNNPEGPDMEWKTEDDGFGIQTSAREGRAIVVRPLPNDFADFDDDGETVEELPLDSDGTPFGSGPFFYGAYPEP